MIKSLHARHNDLATAANQIAQLNNLTEILPFEEKLKQAGLFPLRAQVIDIFQMNVGYMCNQTCAHCHVDAGPDRTEIMTRETMQKCLDIIAANNIRAVDITGGAPEMNPHFIWLVEECTKLNVHVIVRCNLTIIVANEKYKTLPSFFAKHKVEVISSLPFYNASRTDKQRGDGVFAGSIKALQMLNSVGYGKAETGLILNLVYNPSGAFLPAAQTTLERDFKLTLKRDFDIDFNNLFCITNMPISRFLDYLIQSNNYENYMSRLVNAFNPAAVAGLMCRNTLSVGWDGYLYDCDFNQMLGLKVENKIQHIDNFDAHELQNRNIVLNKHCYGCAAGAGSSCGGETIK